MNMEKKTPTPNYWPGLILIIIGGIFTLHTFHIMDIGGFFHHWWPAVLILIGLYKLKGRDKTWGAIFFVSGSILLLSTLDIINWGSILRFWPVLLIALGVNLIMKSRRTVKPVTHREDRVNDDVIQSVTLFGGVDRVVTSNQFRGGDITVIFGGADLDLRQMTVDPEGCELNLTALFGGIEVRVSADTQVSISGTPFLGAIENNTDLIPDSEVKQQLYIRCTTAFGGIEIRN